MNPPRRAAVPNPATPRQLRPVEIISDRAKRYRANRNPPAGPRRCAFCAATRNIDIDHIDGDERNGDSANLQYLCRSCNTRKGIVQRNAGAGRRTVQRNPAPASWARYAAAIGVLRGDTPGDAHAAARQLQATPPARRADYTARIARERNPKPAKENQPPSYAQYARAVSIHRRGSHDEGGKVIHATPPALRSEYARQIAGTKKLKREDVPF